MTFANKHNKANTKVFTYEQVEKPQWIKLKALYEQGADKPEAAFTILGCFINHGSQFGDQPALVCEGYNVNLPAHMLPEIRDILNDQEDINAINEGRVGAYVYEYVNSRGGKSYGLRWVDKEPLPF